MIPVGPRKSCVCGEEHPELDAYRRGAPFYDDNGILLHIASVQGERCEKNQLEQVAP